MMSRPLLSLFVSCAMLNIVAGSFGAPPKSDWLFPAGTSRGSTTTITSSDGASWPVKVWIDRGDGVTIEPHQDKGKLTVTTTAEAMPGVRWIRLHNEEGASALRPLIIGTLAEIEEKEPNNAKAQEVTLPVVVNGRLEKNGDVDSFRVRLGRGQVIICSMTANETLGSPMDGVIQFCDADGFVLTQNDDTRGLDPMLVFEAPRDGEYVVRTFGFPATPDSTINFAGGATFIYRLTLTTGPFVDHTLPLTAARNGATEIALFGWNLSPELSRLSAVAEADREVAVLFNPSFGSVVELPVSDSAVVVAEQGQGDGGKDAQPQMVQLPAIVTGRIASQRGSGVFRFAATKGQTIRLRAESQSLGYALDPVLRISDSQGKQLSENDDDGKKARDAGIDFKPAADGEYIVSVRDLHGRGGFRFVYRLTMEPVAANFTASLERDVFVAEAGKPMEVAVAINRMDGFDGEIRVRIEGLPEGVAVPPVVSKQKDATEKAVKLSFTVPGAAAGPFRVVAESDKLRRVATFATVGDGRHTAAWFTATAPPPAKK